MRQLTTLVLLLSLSTAAAAGPFSKRAERIAERNATPVAQVDEVADYSDAWRAYLGERREVQLERLNAYAADGVFPVNTQIEGLTNLFMDGEGRRCAMAHLIWEDGEQDVVNHYAATNNGVLLGEVTDGPLHDWMLTSGLTQTEAAFIQGPDFQVNFILPQEIQLQLVDQEQERLRAHFAAAALQVEVYGDTSLDAAVQALGDRVQQPPPSSADSVADAA